MAKKVAGELYESITGQLFEIGRQLRQSNGYPYDPEKLKKHLQDGIEGKFSAQETQKKNEFLKLLSGGESLVLDAVDGTETLAKAKDVFSWIDPDFKNWGTDEKGPATKETSVAVYEVQASSCCSRLRRAGRNWLDLCTFVS